jgi:FlaA1/EpsC-like NDP-sugar epimerase
MKNNYGRFGLMVLTSTLIMLVLMYFNVYSTDHIFFSETRFYMALIMGAVMAIVMLSFMNKLYTNKKANLGIYAGSALIIAVSLFLVHSQATVDDESWMKAMIPHHSIAILTSERADIEDPRVKNLADDIIKAQRKEIAEMKTLIKDLEEKED